ncbi:MAG: hypothetical protein RL077_2317 [Verrucomicrobiota bacterium]|jgi:hypothetical protein
MRARHKRSGGERRSKFFCRKFSVVSARGKKQGRGPSRFLATLVSKSDFRTGSTKLWLFSKSVRRSVSEPSGHPGPPAKIAPGKGRAESGLITRMGAWKWSLQRRTPAITHAETAERYRPSEYAERGRRHYSRGGAETRRGRDGSASSAPPRLRVIQSFEFSRCPRKSFRLSPTDSSPSICKQDRRAKDARLVRFLVRKLRRASAYQGTRPGVKREGFSAKKSPAGVSPRGR